MPDADDTPDIETGADTLLSFLEEKTKWPVSKIADEMGVPKETVKQWAKALEKGGLVEIKYSAIKGMVLEYASDKSYEELNQGRSELALEADELEIEAEEVETVEDNEKESVAETEHTESSKEDESVETNNDKDELSGLESGNSLDKSAEDLTEEEGKEKLKQELESLENKEKDADSNDKAKLKTDKAKIKNDSDSEPQKSDSQEESDSQDESSGNSTKAKLKAGKAQIKKSGSEDNGDSEDSESHESAVKRIADKVKSQPGKDVDHEAGSDLDDILDNIEELGSLLEDEDIGNGEVYGRMEHEMEALKDTLVEEEITSEKKRKVAGTMAQVETDIENASDRKSIFTRIAEFLQNFRGKIA
ncbi:hypothetical protein [Candidatus Nanohalobium constans]|uniref:Uncharacterized protein n=1 Tax=Candidatus Nanohalobium constans TaxID=2565781 RepID=A0A5Q0UH95_9ARCH|nr:hypothetical protein [Candidatus Nanohalobium constans]QGA80997.1 hypothetical protein LC1Nh_1129 [Candidatus Nanohalobium constans]